MRTLLTYWWTSELDISADFTCRKLSEDCIHNRLKLNSWQTWTVDYAGSYSLLSQLLSFSLLWMQSSGSFCTRSPRKISVLTISVMQAAADNDSSGWDEYSSPTLNVVYFLLSVWWHSIMAWALLCIGDRHEPKGRLVTNVFEPAGTWKSPSLVTTKITMPTSVLKANIITFNNKRIPEFEEG